MSCAHNIDVYVNWLIVNLQIACLQLINAIVATPDDLEFRLHLRNEIMRVGLMDILDVSSII